MRVLGDFFKSTLLHARAVNSAKLLSYKHSYASSHVVQMALVNQNEQSDCSLKHKST